MTIPNPVKTREWKDGNSPSTGTPALGSYFNEEFDQLYENDNDLDDKKLDKSGGTISGSLVVQGDLEIQGTSTQIKTTDLVVKDKIITLNNGESGPGISGDGISGIEVDRGSGQVKARMIFDEAVDEFKFGFAGTEEAMLTKSNVPQVKEPSTGQTYSAFTYDQAIFATPSADIAIDIKAGASLKGITCLIKNEASSDSKITLTIAVGVTEIIYRGSFRKYIWDGTKWRLLSESRIGKVFFHTGGTLPRGSKKLDGTEYNRADYPELWHWAQNETTTVDDTTWLAGSVGSFSQGSVVTKFKVPDWEGLHLRFAGANSVKKMSAGGASDWFDGGSVLSISNDMQQSHLHNIKNVNGTDLLEINPSGTGATANGQVASLGITSNANRIETNTPVTDGTNGNPRVGKETKPATVSIIPCIYYED